MVQTVSRRRRLGILLNLANGLFLLAMVVVIFLQVVARYIFNHALSWPEELGRFLFAWIVFLGTVSVMQSDEMLALDVIYNWIPKKVGKILQIVISLIVLGFLLVMVKGGHDLMVRQASHTSVGLQIPMSIVYFIIPFATSLMALVMICKIVNQVRSLFLQRDANRNSNV